MKANFEKDGFLDPVMFAVTLEAFHFAAIPPELLQNQQSKSLLKKILESKTKEPGVIAVGVILEAWGCMLEKEKDSGLLKLIQNETLNVRDLKYRENIILMIFSTPEKDELCAFCVDAENKKVLGSYIPDGEMMNGGLFSNFFAYTRN